MSYDAQYFGERFSTSLSLTAKELATAQKGKYDIKENTKTTGQCTGEDLINIGFDYTDLNQVKRKCDSLPECRSFMWSEHEVDDKGGLVSKAYFCKVDVYYERSAPQEHFAVARRTQVSQWLKSQDAMEMLYKIGLSETVPKLLNTMFGAYGEMYGFKFKPSVTVDDKHDHWLQIKIEPTTGEYDKITTQMHKNLLCAVRAVALMEHGEGAEINCDLLATSIDGAFQERGKKYSLEWSSTQKIAKSQMLQYESELDEQVGVVMGVDPAGTTRKLLKVTHEDIDANQKDMQAREKKEEVKAKVLDDGGKITAMIKKTYVDSQDLKESVHLMTLVVQQRLATLALKEMKVVLAHMDGSLPPLKLVAQALQKRMPVLKSITISKFYLQCVYGSCDGEKIQDPEFSVCFTEIGCAKSGGNTPGMPMLSQWINDQAVALIGSWMKKMLKFGTVTVETPAGVKAHTKTVHVANKMFQLQIPGMYNVENVTMMYPTSVRTEKLQAFEQGTVDVPNEDAIVAHTLMPEEFQEKHLEKDLVSGVTDPELQATMRAGFEMELKKDEEQDPDLFHLQNSSTKIIDTDLMQENDRDDAKLMTDHAEDSDKTVEPAEHMHVVGLAEYHAKRQRQHSSDSDFAKFIAQSDNMIHGIASVRKQAIPQQASSKMSLKHRAMQTDIESVERKRVSEEEVHHSCPSLV